MNLLKYEGKAPSRNAECPECGTPLELRKFIDCWDAKDKPADVTEDLYCPKCDLRWAPEYGPHDFYEG
jgi:hypothetical protein